jgi:hypothetical protein
MSSVHIFQSLSAHPDVVAVLEEQYSQTKDVRTLKKFLVVVVCSCLSQGLKTVSLKDLEFARSLFSVDSKETILKSLTVLEMMLVVATRRVKDVRPNSPINFEMVYREYKQFTQSSNSVPFYKKAVAMKTFEHLQSLEVIAPVDFEGGGSKLLKEYTHVILTVTDEHIEQALLAHKTCPAEVVHWGTGPGVAAWCVCVCVCVHAPIIVLQYFDLFVDMLKCQTFELPIKQMISGDITYQTEIS